MHLFIKSSIFYNFWHSFGARVWDIFSISGNALMNHFFSIVISCKKAKNGFCEVLRIRCTFSLKVQFFIIFGIALGPEFEISSQFRKCAYESLLQHRNILQKSEKRLCEVLRIRCTFSLKVQFFIIFGIALGPEFEISSQFQEMRLWITSSAS